MAQVRALRDRAIALATTDRNAEEFAERLVRVFGWPEEEAWAEVNDVLEVLSIIPAREYEHFRAAADRRLAAGGKSDWPALAAALALEAEIWTDDRDFFGVGVPIWSSRNVDRVETAE